MAPIVNPLNVNVPLLEILDPAADIVIVPPLGLKFALVPMLNVPPTEKLLDVVTVAEFDIVRLLNVIVPEFEIDEPLFIVIVPLVGVNVPLTVNAPPTVAVFEAPVIEPLTFKFPYVKLDSISPLPL